MRQLTNEQTVERYGLTLDQWKSLREGQRSGLRKNRSNLRRIHCECGNIATVKRTHGAICQRCAYIEAQRGQRFDGHGIGESCGVRDGYDPFTVNL